MGRDETWEFIRRTLAEEKARAAIPHEQQCNRGRHYKDKQGRTVCDQTPVKKYLWHVIDRDIRSGRMFERTIAFPRSAVRAQEIIDELNAKEPKRPWWKGKRYYAEGWQEWAWNGGKIRYLR